ncbi:hypothetical protein [Streptococcus saliviloxodontae]|nr:hypothetical protein [Streptococcus saliviloxodontae]
MRKIEKRAGISSAGLPQDVNTSSMVTLVFYQSHLTTLRDDAQ